MTALARLTFLAELFPVAQPSVPTRRSDASLRVGICSWSRRPPGLLRTRPREPSGAQGRTVQRAGQHSTVRRCPPVQRASFFKKKNNVGSAWARGPRRTWGGARPRPSAFPASFFFWPDCRYWRWPRRLGQCYCMGAPTLVLVSPSLPGSPCSSCSGNQGPQVTHARGHLRPPRTGAPLVKTQDWRSWVHRSWGECLVGSKIQSPARVSLGSSGWVLISGVALYQYSSRIFFLRPPAQRSHVGSAVLDSRACLHTCSVVAIFVAITSTVVPTSFVKKIVKSSVLNSNQRIASPTEFSIDFHKISQFGRNHRSSTRSHLGCAGRQCACHTAVQQRESQT